MCVPDRLSGKALASIPCQFSIIRSEFQSGSVYLWYLAHILGQIYKYHVRGKIMYNWRLAAHLKMFVFDTSHWHRTEST